MKSAETLLAAAMVVVLGVAAGIVAGVRRAQEAPPSSVSVTDQRPHRFALEVGGRQIVVWVGTAPPSPATPTPSPAPVPFRNSPPPPP